MSTIICSTLAQVDHLINEIQTSTRTRYIRYSNTGAYDKPDWQPSQKMQVFFEKKNIGHKAAVAGIPFCGTPFTSVGSRRFQCHQGKDQSIADKKKKADQKIKDIISGKNTKRRRFLVQDSKKVGCTASVNVTRVAAFPDEKFQIDEITSSKRQKAAHLIRNDLSNNKNVRWENRYYVLLPQMEDHVGHPPIAEGDDCTGKKNTASSKKNYAMGKNKISKVVKQDDQITTGQDFAQHSIDAQLNLKALRESETKTAVAIKYITNKVPDLEDETHYAAETETEIKSNHITIAASTLPTNAGKIQTTHNTVQLQKLIEGWRKRDPQDNFYFRSQSHQYNQEFLIVHQTSFQRHLLHRYGQDVCLLDSTHKTRLNISPFFLVVRTNFCYVVVATFVLQHETRQTISEALEIIKNWTKDWSPKNFMVDLNKAQINAVESVFQGCQAVLCDFYCEKAWAEWTNSIAHNIQDRNKVLNMLRQISHSDTKAKYEQTLKTLEESEEWIRNYHLRNWFNTTWMTECQRWVAFHYDESLHRNILTIKGVENLDTYFKNNYFESCTESAISDMMTILVDKVFPDQQMKYFELNVQSSPGYRKYNNKVPKFLQNRPREIVMYILKRYNSPECDQVTMISETSFTVKCSTDNKRTYQVSMGTESRYESCNCPDWKRKRLPCKHFCAIIKRGWDWEDLCHKFKDNPLFQLDPICFSGNLESQPSESITVEVDSTSIILDEEVEEVVDSSMNLDEEEEENEDAVLHDIPARKKCISITKTIQDRLYLIQDEEYLETLYAKMGEILNEMGSHVPNVEGFTIPYPTKKRKKLKQPAPKEKRTTIHSLTRKKKKQKQDIPALNPELLPNPYLPPCPTTSHSNTSYSSAPTLNSSNLNLTIPFDSTSNQLYPAHVNHSTKTPLNITVFKPITHSNPSSYCTGDDSSYHLK